MKQKNIIRFFNAIAKYYDMLNHILSAYQDVLWRRKLISYIPKQSGQRILDLATGTGEVLFEIAHCKNHSNACHSLTGIDLSEKMLEYAKKKAKQETMSYQMNFQVANAETLPFDDEQFDVVTVAFGLRNMENYLSAIQEVSRVLKTGGHFLILEFSLPHWLIPRWIYLIYFRYILPVIGGLISGNYKAYRYLNQSVERFPYGQKFCDLIEGEGFSSVRKLEMTFGIVSLYCANK